MANTHRYGFRLLRNLWGGDTPEPETRPIASGYQPNTGTPNTNVNLNIGDPVSLLETGAVALTAPGGSNGIATDGTESVYGIVVGIQQVLINGALRPSAYYPGGTVYGSGLVPYSLQTLVKVIPVVGREFEIDCDAAGGSSLDSMEEFQGMIWAGADIVYSPINTTSANPKANPMLDISDLTEAHGDSVRQLRVTGIGRAGDTQDLTATNVTLRVVFNAVKESPFHTVPGVTTA